MNIKFGDSNIITCYIKELLHNFNLPKATVYNKELEVNNVLYDGKVYIKDGKITRYKDGEFKKIASFVYNYPILNFTKRFIIKSSTYDNYTHKYLGDYLRFMRDYNNVDLMSMYNCFTGEEPKRIFLQDANDKAGVEINSTTGVRFILNTDDTNYNYYLTPIKFDRTYTIALSANVRYDIVCLLYNDIFVSMTPDELIKESYKHVGGSTFSTPFTYSTH